MVTWLRAQGRPGADRHDASSRVRAVRRANERDDLGGKPLVLDAHERSHESAHTELGERKEAIGHVLRWAPDAEPIAELFVD